MAQLNGMVGIPQNDQFKMQNSLMNQMRSSQMNQF